MKRIHLHVGVANLDRSIAFYTALFGAPPRTVKADYAKWLLDDPRVNFAISLGACAGVDHVGVQTDDEAGFAELRGQLAAGGLAARDEPDAVCCYARSTKAWLQDPDGLVWETFVTRGEAAETPPQPQPASNGREADSAADESVATACCGTGAEGTAARCC